MISEASKLGSKPLNERAQLMLKMKIKQMSNWKYLRSILLTRVYRNKVSVLSYLTIHYGFFVIFFACFFSNMNAAPIQLVKIAEVQTPVGMAAPADGTGRIFILEQAGIIRIIKNGKLLSEPFLDIRNKLSKPASSYSEKGLLGFAFHPDYKRNGRFFINYSAPTKEPGFDHKTVVEEYKVSSNADRADASGGKIILTIEQPESNHNGGDLAFGPDGFLYIASGDGGGAGDRHGKKGNGQDLTSLLGKILRIDINGKTSYRIPQDNPFARSSARPEIYAYGLRNPWKISFDRVTGELYAADVGQDKWEEVNIIKKGKNYGWRVLEGNHCYEKDCNPEGKEPPIYEYDHSFGRSIIGGYVYRGKNKAYHGSYLFGDWVGKFLISKKKAGKYQAEELKLSKIEGEYILSFGEDQEGELYVLMQKGMGPNKQGYVYRVNFQ